MCDSLEVMRTHFPPQGLSGNAWVRPVLIGYAADASGLSMSVQSASCQGWNSSEVGNTGLTVYPGGSFDVAPAFSGCEVARPVACCAAAPSPIMATVPFGSSGPAFLVLALLVVSVAAMGRRRSA